MISYGKQDINQDDIDAVVGILKSDFLTQGPQVPLFEKTVSSRTESFIILSSILVRTLAANGSLSFARFTAITSFLPFSFFSLVSVMIITVNKAIVNK